MCKSIIYLIPVLYISNTFVSSSINYLIFGIFNMKVFKRDGIFVDCVKKLHNIIMIYSLFYSYKSVSYKNNILHLFYNIDFLKCVNSHSSRICAG
jgi:hypothetical protein